MFTFLTVLVVVLGLLRGFGVTHVAFQAISHIFVAYLFTVTYYDRENRYRFLGLSLGFTLIEVAAFVFLKG